MITRSRFLLPLLVLGAAATLHAAPAPARPAPARAVSPLWAALDTDHNGVLSPGEIAAAPAALTALDLDEDGTISADERQAFDADGHARPARPGSLGFNLLVALDANHDGALQPLEIANAAASLKGLDRNGDGLVAAAELRPILVAQSR